MNDIVPILEAVIFASSEPVSLAQLESIIQESTENLALNSADATQEKAVAQVDRSLLKEALNALQADYANRAVNLAEVASGYQFRVKPEYSSWVAKLSEERPQRYGRAFLETLALIVYRQPITRAEIEEVRGVAVSSHILRAMIDREWVKVVGYKDVPGKPALLATTKIFLDYFNLKNLRELPPLEAFTNLDEAGEQLEMLLHETDAAEIEQIEQIEHIEKSEQVEESQRIEESS